MGEKLLAIKMEGKLTLASRVEQFFSYSIEDNKTKCLLPNCNVKLSGRVPGNMKRHLALKHLDNIDVAELTSSKRFKGTRTRQSAFGGEGGDSDSDGESSTSSLNRITIKIKQKVKIEVDTQEFIKGCVKLAVENNVSCEAFDSEGFNLIAKPYEAALGFKINAERIKRNIGKAAANIREKVTCELKSKMVSLKIDVATKCGRGILSINAHYIDRREYRVEHLGMIELTKQGGVYLVMGEILKILNQFELKIEQFYSITTDCGSNMVKLLENEDFQELEIFEEILPADDAVDNAVINELSKLKFSSSADQLQVECTRSVAHTLQLVVGDITDDLKEELDKVRSIVKEMQKVKHRTLYSNSNTKLPILDVNSRWMSTYMMVANLNENLQFYKDVTKNPNVLVIVDSATFVFIPNFISALKPIFIATQKFLEEQMVVGDFICAWEKCMMTMGENRQNPYTEKIIQRIEVCREILFETDAIVAAIYLDPRFVSKEMSLLTAEQTKRAQEHLLKTWIMLTKNNPNYAQKEQQHQSTLSSDEDPDAKLVSFMQTRCSYQIKREPSTEEIPPDVDNVKDKINFWPRTVAKRLSFNTDILKFFDDKRFQDPEMFQLAKVVLSLPPTQVSMQRAFDALNLILTAPQTRYTPESLENLMITKLNSNYLNEMTF